MIHFSGRLYYSCLLILTFMSNLAFATLAYVPNSNDTTVTVIEATLSDNTVVTNADVGGNGFDNGGPFISAVTPDGSRVYIPIRGLDQVSVLNASTNTVEATIPVGSFPMQALYVASNEKVYVINNNSSNVSVIDANPSSGTYNTVIATLSVGTNPVYEALDLSNIPPQIYIANKADGTVSVINIISTSVIATVTVGSLPINIDVTTIDAYVANSGDNTVSAIRTANNTVVATIPVGTLPTWITVTPDKTRAYVANKQSSNVSVIDTNKLSGTFNTVIATIPTDTGPDFIAFTSDGDFAYVADFFGNTVDVIDTNPSSGTYNTVIATIPVGTNPLWISITPDGTEALVVNQGSTNVSVIDLSDNTVIATLAAVNNPTSIALNPVPIVAAVNPDEGPIAGGTSVTITGFNFTGATAVFFGGVPAASFTVNSDTSITAVSPPGTGTVDVTVVTPNGTSPINQPGDQFTYESVLTPEILSINPTSGPTSGGTAVTITGANFTGTTAVLFGTKPAVSFTVNSDSSITAVSPPGTGTVDVRVVTPAGTSPVTPADRFTYISVRPAPPTHFDGVIIKNKFLNTTEYVLEATWFPSTSADVAFYRIYYRGRLIDVVPADGPFIFFRSLHSTHDARDFSISALTTSGLESRRVKITIVGVRSGSS